MAKAKSAKTKRKISRGVSAWWDKHGDTTKKIGIAVGAGAALYGLSKGGLKLNSAIKTAKAKNVRPKSGVMYQDGPMMPNMVSGKPTTGFTQKQASDLANYRSKYTKKQKNQRTVIRRQAALRDYSPSVFDAASRNNTSRIDRKIAGDTLAIKAYYLRSLGNYFSVFIGDTIEFEKTRRTRSDKGKPRGTYKLRSPVVKEEPKKGPIGSAAKYGAGLLGTVGLWEAGSKLASKGAEKATSKIAPKAHPRSLVGMGKKAAVLGAALVGGDVAARAGISAYRRAKKRYENRKKKK